MGQQKEKITTKCQKCGYEFLVPNSDPCPKCGSISKDYKIELPPETITLSDSLTIQQDHLTQKKEVHNLVNAIIIIITIISLVIGFFCEDKWVGLLVAIIISVVTLYLGKNYAEKWIIERIIERDHYH